MDLTLLEEQLELLRRYWEDPLPGLKFDGETEDPLLSTPSGVPTLRLKGKYLHSRHDPMKEALRLVEALKIKAAETPLFFGAGLGYQVRLMCDRFDGSCIWMEPTPEVLLRALAVNDFRRELKSGRMVIVPFVPGETELARIFKGKGNRQIRFILHRPSLSLSPVYERIATLCENFLNKKDVNLATLARFDRLWAANLMRNFPILSRARPVAELFRIASGCAAVVCGAGPSLQDSLDEIRKVRKRVILISVDTALKVLTAAGIDPDLVVSVDPQPLNRHYLEGYEGGALLVVDPTTSYHSLRSVDPRRIFYFHSPFALSRLLFRHVKGEIGEIAFGGSVSTNAYDLALRIGAVQIRLVGQDLSFTSGRAHVQGAVLEERLNWIETRTFRREIHNYRQLYALPVRKLPAIGGGEVPTNDKMVIFYRWFQNRFALDRESGLDVINSTVEGALFPGIPHLPLAESLAENEGPLTQAAEEFHSRKCGLNDPGYLHGREDAILDRKAYLDGLEGTLRELKEMLTLLGEGVEHSRRLRNGLEAGAAGVTLKPILDSLDEIDAKLNRSLELSRTVGEAMQGVIFRITGDREDGPSDEEAKQGSGEMRIAERSLRLYESLEETVRFHIREVEHCLAVEGSHF